MRPGLGHEQSPEQSQMWAALAPLQMCVLNSAYLGLRWAAAGSVTGSEECGQEGEISREIGIGAGSAGPAGLASCCSLERDERMEFGPALFPCVMPLPLFLSLISPPGPGGCEDLAPADPQSCPQRAVGIPAWIWPWLWVV